MTGNGTTVLRVTGRPVGRHVTRPEPPARRKTLLPQGLARSGKPMPYL